MAPSHKPLLDLLCRHLVAITTKVLLKNGQLSLNAVSAFVMEISGHWFLVTAGHLLKELRRIKEEYPDAEYALFDAWAPGAKVELSIPFNPFDSATLAVDVPGVDLGIVHIPHIVRAGLASNGVKAFVEATWRGLPDDFEHFRLLGIPSKFVVPIADKEELQVSAVVLSLKECDEPAEMKKPYERFYGRLPKVLLDEDTQQPLDDIDGMSGGPIIGFAKRADGKSAYFLLAIQSSWHPGLRVVAGNYAQGLGTAVSDFLAHPPPDPNGGSIET